LLLVHSSSNDMRNRETRICDFIVRIREPQILMSADDLVVPSEEEVREVEKALSWVLYALFAYSEELGLGRLPYW
jgi:hypothetical protein